MPDDDVVLPDAQPESPEPTQPLGSQQTEVDDHAHRSPPHRATSDSFHSAQENVRRGGTVEPVNVDASPMHKVEVQVPRRSEEKKSEQNIKEKPARPESGKPRDHEVDTHHSEQEEPARTAPKAGAAQSDHQQGGEDDASENRPLDNLEDIGSPSDESTPGRPLIRKSSLTFASLPAREPLTKKSLGGPGISGTSHVGAAKPSTGGSGFGRQTGGRSTHAAVDENSQDDKMDVDVVKDPENDSDARATKLHSKSSTQRLHEKISMLGKSQPSRPTKSIPSSQVAYPDLPAVKPDTKPEPSGQKARETPAPDATEVENDDWIKPLDSPRPALRKSQTMHVMEVDRDDANNDQMDIDDANGAAADRKPSPPQTRQKSMSVSNVPDGESTTPIGSPERRDGPLSASKSRLQSIMKSAKGLFSSTGGASTGTKAETSSPDEPRIARNRANTHTAGVGEERPSPVKEGRRTRSSTEREERRKQQELEDRRDEEQSRLQEAAAKEKTSVEPEARPASPRRLPRPQRQAAKEPEPADTGSKSAASHSTQSSKPADRRPVKPTREAAQKPKPQPVSIRVGSALSRQMPLASSSLSSSVHESNTPAPPSSSKQQTVKKPSNSSLHTAPSNSSFKSSASNQSQRKAQLASERKKEQEEREARRKEEQKRELERKRAAQQEEARRQEMRNRAETERKERERAAVEDSKKTAQAQAIEKRRLENARRVDRQGSQQPSEPVS